MKKTKAVCELFYIIVKQQIIDSENKDYEIINFGHEIVFIIMNENRDACSCSVDGILDIMKECENTDTKYLDYLIKLVTKQ